MAVNAPQFATLPRRRRQPPETDLPSPGVDLGGASVPARTARAGNDQFFTGILERSLVLGPTSLDAPVGTRRYSSCQTRVLAVADGLSAGAASEVASGVAMRTLAEFLTVRLSWLSAGAVSQAAEHPALGDELTAAYGRCQRAVRAALARSGFRETQAGTTLSCACIHWPHLVVAHVGDGRALLQRGGRLTVLTRDDTVGAELRAHAAPARSADARSDHWDGVLTQAVGAQNQELDVQIAARRLDHGDVIALVTAGPARALDRSDGLAAALSLRAPAQARAVALTGAASRRYPDRDQTAAVACIGDSTAA